MRERILGPFEGFQLTHNELRETENGTPIATLGFFGWVIGNPYRSKDLAFSDIVILVELPKSVLG